MQDSASPQCLHGVRQVKDTSPLSASSFQNACSEPSSRESWTLPEVQAALALQEPPCTSAAGLPRTLTAASHGQTETLAWNCQLPHWSECLHLAQQKVAIHGGQQPWIARVDKQRAGITSITTGLSATGQLPDSTARHQAQENTAGLSMVCQVPGSIAGQLATGQVPGSSPQPLPGCAKQHHTAAAQTQSVAALQRIANTVPSWAETTLPDHPGSPHFQGFLASAVMLETLGRQKRMEALSLHASSTQEKGAMEPKKNETHGQGSRQGPASPGSKHEVNPGQGQGGSSPESSISHKWVHPSLVCIALSMHTTAICSSVCQHFSQEVSYFLACYGNIHFKWWSA